MLKGVLFDLDGVLTATDTLHSRAWKATCERWKIPFAGETAPLLRGIGRLDCVRLILHRAGMSLSEPDCLAFAEEKNRRYLVLLDELSTKDVLPGVEETIAALDARGILTAVASASKNAPLILRRIGLEGRLTAVVDGTMITRTKPDPEVFDLAAKALGLLPKECLVVEDAPSGIAAAKRSGAQAAAIGPDAKGSGADIEIERITDILSLWK
ncbi:MAG TPA: beta-phosphoglucomutase [Feifaniaceae bacterium]|nr:beta-phosphoglucomutase [Feifaniaceae bacterium]